MPSLFIYILFISIYVYTNYIDDPGSTENLDLPGGYPGNSSGQLNSPDGGNNYCQSSNNNNNIPQVRQFIIYRIVLKTVFRE